MVISPETLIKTLLSNPIIIKKEKDCLFFNNCAIVIFDGLIIWRGNLNMKYAIPNLLLLNTAIGLPIAVIEKQVFRGKKKYHIGKHCGPGNWIKCSWDSDCGLNIKLINEYNEDGYKRTKTLANNNTTTKQNITYNRHPEIIDLSGWRA